MERGQPGDSQVRDGEMKISIVGVLKPDEQILTRCARYLAEGTGWPVCNKADAGADINVYVPYLLFDKNRRDGKHLGWFTHYDTSVKEKAFSWNWVSKACDYRLACADQYVTRLACDGPAAKVSPPLDWRKFAPSKRVRHQQPTVGVSGYIYGGGRKGERILTEMLTLGAGQVARFTASGKGWPVPAHDWTWATMQEYYRTLDVYLCTALIEGIPMPPLEAMACGRPAVVPAGVGMLDELSGLPGVFMYEKGNAESALDAIRLAIADTTPAEEIADAVRRYNLAAWCKGFQQAIEEMTTPPALPPAPAPIDVGDISRCGVYIVAFGDPARKCAERCVASLRRHMPGLPVAVVSDRPLGVGEIAIPAPDLDIGGRWAKLNADMYAPREWEYVVYLDADTELMAPIHSLFAFLRDGWEFVICKDIDRYGLASNMRRPDNVKEADATFKEIGSDQLLQYNGGVFGFRRGERMHEFFNVWRAEYDRWAKRDQGALLRAIHRCRPKLYVLTNSWNHATERYTLNAEVIIAHHNVEARRWRGIINGRLDSQVAWDAVRVWDGIRDP